MNRRQTLFCLFLLLPPALVWPQTEKTFHHKGWVGAVVFSPDGQTLYSGGADHQIFAWDLAKKGGKQSFPGHTDAVCALALTADGKTLASGSFDGDAKLWDPATGKVRHTLKGHRGAVMAVAFTPDNLQLATGGMEGTVFLWDVSTGKKIGVITQHRSWVNALAFAKDGTLATGSSDNTVRLLQKKDNAKWVPKETSEIAEGEIRTLAFSPDGKKLAMGARYGVLSIWDRSGNAVKELRLPGHGADVWAVGISSDGKTLASGDGDWDRPGQVFLWDLATGKKKGTLNHTGEVLSLAFSPTGDRLAGGGWDKAIQVWKLK